MTPAPNTNRVAHRGDDARARAYAEIVGALDRAPDPLRCVSEWGARAVDAVIALEAAFGIELEVDEVLHLRLAGLIDLVAGRALVVMAAEPIVWDAGRGVFIFPGGALLATPAGPGPDEDPIPAFLTAARSRRPRARRALVSMRGWALLTYLALYLAAFAYGAWAVLHTGGRP